MLIFRLILRSGRVDDRRKRRLTTDKGNLKGIISITITARWGREGPVVEISGFEAVEAVEAE
jgi:hypothetical protein